MKIFIASDNCCSLNYQHTSIYFELFEHFEITKDVRDADVIVCAETCSCTAVNILGTINYIDSIIKKKKDTAKVYVTGCITRQFKDVPFLVEVKNWLSNNVDFIIPQNQPNLLLKLISEEHFGDRDINDFGSVQIKSENEANIYIANGCLNNCSFCKVTFQKYLLKSVAIDILKESIDELDEENISQINLKGTNICQYGLDLYNEYMLPEIIEYLETKRNIKKISLVGFSFKDAIKNDFQEVLKNSTKVIELSGSLESGSDRLLKMIRKGFTSDEIIEFVNYIRQKKYKNLYLNIIAGFPTETLDDVKRTIEVLNKLKPYAVDVCRYTNSSFIDSNKYEQLTLTEIQEHARIYSRVLKKNSRKVKILGNGYISNGSY